MTRHDERGITDSMQWAILLPVILLTVFGILQVGLWAHGRTVATQAAVTGAERGALADAPAGDGPEAARRVAAAGGLVGVEVTLTASPESVTVTVRGSMPTFVDLSQTAVSEQATRPKERVTQP